MLDGAMALWWILTIQSFLFVASMCGGPRSRSPDTPAQPSATAKTAMTVLSFAILGAAL
jgi:hypothetical protein